MRAQGTAEPAASVRQAIILAAGLCTRLRPVVDDRPKGLIEIAGETIVGRSIRLLRDAGIEHITIVAGYRADFFVRFADGQPDIHLLLNDEFATTGSMASLAVALDRVQQDALVLESDIVYEARAVKLLLQSVTTDATLISGPTGAGDEVWVHAPGGRLQAMSKAAQELPAISGEFVGISKLSARATRAMLQAFTEFVDTHGHGRMDYETGALVAVGRLLPIAAVLVPDLCWGEVDDEGQLERVVQKVWPAVGDQLPPVRDVSYN